MNARSHSPSASVPRIFWQEAFELPDLRFGQMFYTGEFAKAAHRLGSNRLHLIRQVRYAGAPETAASNPQPTARRNGFCQFSQRAGCSIPQFEIGRLCGFQSYRCSLHDLRRFDFAQSIENKCTAASDPLRMHTPSSWD